MSSPRGQLRVSADKGQLDTDWAICLVRWALIASIPIIALLDPADHFSPSNLAPIMIATGACNLLITLLLVFRLFPPIMPALTLIADALGTFVLLYLSGRADSPFFFFPLFPILVATLRFSWRAGILTAGIFVLGFGLWTVIDWEEGQGSAPLFQVGLRMLLLVLAAVIGGAMSRQMAPAATSGKGGRPAEGAFVPEYVKMVYEMASTLSATLNYHRVLEAILDISRLGFDEFGHRLGESVGMILLYDDDGFLAIASHRNLVVQEDAALRIRGRSGIVEEAIGRAEALIGETPATDPELRVFKSLHPCKSMLCVPLRAGFETYGAVLFASNKRDVYTMEHVDLLTIFCNQATVALQNASLYQTLREERDKIIDKEEEARHKLARDLHDGPTQDVAAIAMRLNFARLLVERDPGRARAELARLEDLAHRTVREIRTMLFTLRPVILETEGLVAALNQYADNIRENDGLPVEVDAERYQDCLDVDAQGVVFAIIEEAMNNARKHAEASRIWVRLAVEGDLFVAQIVDNGKGFDVEATERNYGSRGSLGLINLRERAELVEGSINIESVIGQGTRITLIVPIDQAAL